MQLFLAGARHNLSLFVTGFLLTTGVTFGRIICGYVCPFGFLQDILYKLRTKKVKTAFSYARYLKYIVLLLFVLILPMASVHELTGIGSPWFCKYICPSGTVFAAIPLLTANEGLRRFLGMTFVSKALLTLGITATATVICRFFCRVLCPLGAIYALLNPLAIVRMRCSKAECIGCGQCAAACHLHLSPVNQTNSPECVHCGNCLNACPAKALYYGISERKQHDEITT